MLNHLILQAIFAIIGTSFAFGDDQSSVVRVAIGHNLKSINVSGNLMILGNKIEKARIFLGNGFNINGITVKEPDLTIVSEDGSFYLSGRSYRGELRIYQETSDTLLAVNYLPLEDYVAASVAAEMPLDWPIEALKAQAVAARTYALFVKNAKMGENYLYDLESTVMDQMYRGGLKQPAVEAVEKTMGEVLKGRGKIIKTFYHSTCGGRTESALNVWGEPNSFGTARDSYCSSSPHIFWEYKILRQEMAEKLSSASYPSDTIKNVQIEKRRNNPRVATVVVKTGSSTLFIQGNDFRKIMGFENLKSTWFDVRIDGDMVVFKGRGFGHGVGMCQWGARGMAEAGKSYREILRHYYPGARIGK